MDTHDEVSGITHNYHTFAFQHDRKALTYLLDHIGTTSEVPTSKDPFDRIVGQEHAVRLVRSAVKQRRHVLLCGMPGTGKSMLAEAAYTLLPPPREEIRLVENPNNPDRPLVVLVKEDGNGPAQRADQQSDISYARPEDLPFEVGAKMGYRCPKCGSFALPDQCSCMECGSPKRCDWTESDAYHGLFRMFDVVKERALREVHISGTNEVGVPLDVSYRREPDYSIRVVTQSIGSMTGIESSGYSSASRVLVDRLKPRFVRASGASPVELLGDVKHDPYGSAESLGTPAHLRVVPGAIHEAHEGILYLDEIAALGPYQKHLLTAMQDRKYSISGHNPQSSGAAVRVDDVPCDFILFASCNNEDLAYILPPLRSRIRGYGYEIMLQSSFRKTADNVDALVRFIARTVVEDGRIPHLTVESVEEVLRVAEEMAVRLDGQTDSLTLRLRELGGLVRTSGDLAVQEGADLVSVHHVQQAECVCREIGVGKAMPGSSELVDRPESPCGSYFF